MGRLRKGRRKKEKDWRVLGRGRIGDRLGKGEERNGLGRGRMGEA